MRQTANWFVIGTWTLAAFVVVRSAANAEGLEPTPSSINHLPIDEDVAGAISRIDKLIDKHEWRQAIELCQKLITSTPQGVVELRKGVYGTARTWCEAKLRDLPDSAKLLYRQLYDPEAEALLRRALNERDAVAAQRLVDQFALSSHGLRGISVLADMRMENGDVNGALRLWASWVDTVVPDSLPETARRMGAAKAAVTAAAAGDVRVLERALALFGQRGSALEIGGRTLARMEELRKLTLSLASDSGAQFRAPAPEAMDSVRWEAHFGDRYSALMRDYHGGSEQFGHTCHAEMMDGIIYVNTPDGPCATDALTGRPIWNHHSRNYDSDNYYNSFRSYNFYCRVVRSAGGDGRKLVLVSGGMRLAAYDAQTGRPLWSKTRASFPKIVAAGPDGVPFVSFSSPVFCRDDKVYVMLETIQGEVHLLALALDNGALLWSTNTGGSSPASGARASLPSAITAGGSDIVFYNGCGVIGKCNAATGEIAWLVPYRRRTNLMQGNFYNLRSPLRYSPIVVVDGSIVCMPADGGELVAIQISDGSTKWSIEMKGEFELLGGWHGEGPAPGRLFLAGREIRCLSAATGAILWTWPVPDPPPVTGCVTARGVTVATSKGLYLVDAVRGELVACWPVREIGNDGISIASDADSIALVSGSRIRVLGAKTRTRELLEESRKSSPNDPWTVAAFARFLQREGRVGEAIEQFTRAIQLAQEKRGQPKLADLQREIVGAYEEERREHWRNGRRIEAFQSLLSALRSPGQIPFECRFGYPAESRELGTAPHMLILASGDHVRGRLHEIDSRTLTFVTRDAPWHLPAEAVSRVMLSATADDVRSDIRNDEYIVTEGGDVLSCRVESLRDGSLRVRQRFAVPEELEIKLFGVRAIVFNGRARSVVKDTIYVRLRNGDELSGIPRAFDGDVLVLDIPSCGPYRIRMDDIETVGNRRRMPSGGSTMGHATYHCWTPPDCGAPVPEDEQRNDEGK